MSASIREQILASVQTLLQGTGAPAGLQVYRERTRPIETTSLPAILIYAEDDQPRPFDGSNYRSPLLERDLSIRLECRAQGNQTTPADVALDPVLVWALQTIVQNEKFGGLANGVVEGRSVWNSQEGDVSIASATIQLTIKYRTSRLDPTSQS